MRVLLADDQDDLRSALRLVLAQESNMELVGEVTDLLLLPAEVDLLQPDLLLLDWEFPELKGGEAGRRLLATLHARHPQLHVIALSGRSENRRPALAAGVTLFVSKADPPERLLSALRNILHSLDIQ